MSAASEQSDPRPPTDTGAAGAPDTVSDGELDAAVLRTLDWAEREQLPGHIGLPEPLSIDLTGLVFGDYRVLGELGRGGMGLVLEAEAMDGERERVAIKILDGLMPSQQALTRFHRESRALGKLDHPNVVPLIEANPGSADNKPFTVMQFVEGVSLSQLLVSLARLDSRPLWASEVAALVPGASSIAGSGGFSGSYIDWVLELGVALADGLSHAHDNGVVHRDVKPANIMLTPQGVPVIVDFGLALGEDEGTLTATGAFLGTLPYSPPEQIDGGRVDARSDVYALGVTLYELMAVARPFVAAGRRELLLEIESGAGPAPVEGVSRDLLTVLRTAMQADRDQRYQGAAAFARDLSACVRGSAIEARAPSWWQRGLRYGRRHPLVVAVSLMLLLAMTGLGVYDRVRAGRQVDQAEQHLAAGLRTGRELLRCEAELALIEDPAGLRLMNSSDELPALTLNARWRELQVRFEQHLQAAESQAFQATGFVGGHGGAERVMGRMLRARIERSLVEQRDVLDRDHHRGLVQRLSALDAAPALLDGLLESSPLVVSSDPPGAAFEVREVGADQVLVSGITPQQTLDLPQGSYLVQLSFPGRETTIVPVVVRARAAAVLASLEPDAAPPWSTVDVALPTLGSRPPGWTYVPRGASLVGELRPRWLSFDDFWMQTHEVTLEAILECLNDARALSPISLASDTLLKPRFADNLDSLEVRQGAAGQWLAGPEVKDVRWPARGLSQVDARVYVDYAATVLAPQPAGWYLALPTEAELERASRGADGRLYPWGDQYVVGRCVDAYFDPDGDPEPWPAVVGSAAADVSVFGVRDLAGSVAEWTESAFEPQRAAFVVRGGSYRDRDTSRMSTRSRRALGNRPEVDVGFRMVMRRHPLWIAAAEHPLSWSDDFERPNGDIVGSHWVELNARPMEVPADPGCAETCSVSDGRLVCVGGEGNDSNVSAAWHGVGGSGRSFVMQALLSVESLRQPASRGAALSLMPRVEKWCHELSLGIGSSGALVLAMTSQRAVHQLADLQGDHWAELSSDGDRVSARVWPAGSPRPAGAQLEIDLHPDFDSPAFVIARAGNFCGVRLSVEELSFDGAP